MSCVRVRNSAPSSDIGVLAAQAAKKRNRPQDNADTDVLVPRKPGALKRIFGRRFFAGDVPTPLPPTAPSAPPPAAGGIPSVGNDAPDAISYPRSAADPASWCCCCCPGEGPEVDPALHTRDRAHRRLNNRANT